LVVLPLLAVSLAVLLALRVAWPLLLTSCGALRVMRPLHLPKCSMEVRQLLVELAPGLGNLVEVHLALGVYGAMAQRFFHVGGAACALYFTDEALTREV
jgi:hypothetical protein